MLLPKFEYHEPSTLDEACRIISDLGRGTKLLAGGTDLIVNMKKGKVSPKNVVSVGRIDAMRHWHVSNGVMRIGACMTASDIAESTEMRKAFSALSTGAVSLGSPLIRNLATIAGNLVTARPAADFPPPLMVYEAKVALQNSSGERTVPLDEFFKGPGETVIAPEEILTEIILEYPPQHAGAGYMKLGVRRALEIAKVSVAAFIAIDGKSGGIQDARIALGAVAPYPMRARSAEQVLKGEKPNEALFAKAGEAAGRDSKPIDDFRASAEYRHAMVEVLTRRTLSIAYKEALEH